MKLVCLVLIAISIIGPVVLLLVFIFERLYRLFLLMLDRFLEPPEVDPYYQEMVELLSEEPPEVDPYHQEIVELLSEEPPEVDPYRQEMVKSLSEEPPEVDSYQQEIVEPLSEF
ncbi:hypothetical protein RF11_16051 [Thelohanellus kitauei]|uniref:Uncharacterized protein n=1 Tax=Thelohanellus kitauei TaxID=669202 RepID=A0A0C2MB41_THEKT|nr:hypothetical protein RF11_16051 [Thelohanellus kitauei]